jgi:pimeloyl-ACP methyl ester carboxylesterase
MCAPRKPLYYYSNSNCRGNAAVLFLLRRRKRSLLSFLNIDSAILAGMSQGGFLGMRCALTHPERVRALVLISTQAPRAMKEAIPNAELVVITGGHSVNMTNPGSVNAALNDLFERHHLVS